MPPYAAVLGLSVEADGMGRPVLAMPFADGLVGRPGFLHGGAIAGLLELAAIAALEAALGLDHRVAIKPINATVEFMRGGRNLTTRAGGVVVRLGRRIANVEATAWQDDRDAPIASARLNYLLVRDDADDGGRSAG